MNSTKDLIPIRNSNGQYIGATRKGTKTIVWLLLIAFAITLALFITKGNTTLAGSLGSVDTRPLVGEQDGKVSLGENCVEIKPHSIHCDYTDAKTRQEIYQDAINELPPEETVIVDPLTLKKYTDKYPKADPSVLNTILEVSQEKNFKDTDYLLALIGCESGFSPFNVNAKGNSPSWSVDRGLLQWNNYWEKQISNDCAFSLTCSTEKAIEFIKAGKQSLWSCDRLIRN